MNRAYLQLITLMTVVSMRFEDRKERGATAVEYGLLVGLIAVVMIAGVTVFGKSLTGLFSSVSSKLPTG